MPHADDSSSPVARFATAARAYCGSIERAGTIPIQDRLPSVQGPLLALYAAALSLPVIDAPDGFRELEYPKRPESWQHFEEFERYWEVFDPYVEEPALTTTLSDDLLDVFSDVYRGLQHWDRGDEAAAIWRWRFSFETHWGDHAIDALRALHRACLRIRAGE